MWQLRNIVEADWPQILEIQGQSYPPDLCESREALYSRWLLPGAFCFVAGRGSRVAGYVLAHPWYENRPPALDSVLDHLPNSRLLFIHDLAVAASDRQRGVGEELVRKCLLLAKQSAYTQASLVAVQGSSAFWQKFGFRSAVVGARLETYSSFGEAAVYMNREISDSVSDSP